MIKTTNFLSNVEQRPVYTYTLTLTENKYPNEPDEDIKNKGIYYATIPHFDSSRYVYFIQCKEYVYTGYNNWSYPRYIKHLKPAEKDNWTLVHTRNGDPDFEVYMRLDNDGKLYYRGGGTIYNTSEVYLYAFPGQHSILTEEKIEGEELI